MNEKPRTNAGKTPLAIRLGLWLILLVVALAFTAMVVFGVRGSVGINANLWFPCLFGTLAILFLWLCVRWLSSWRNVRRLLFALACLITAIGLFYAEEDWRGWHAWNAFEREWEPKGAHFDVASTVPPPVPDDQNFALTPVVASSYDWLLDRTGHEIRPRLTNTVNEVAMQYEFYNPPAHIALNGWTEAKKTDLAALQRYYRSLAKTNLFPIPTHPQTPATDVLVALSRYNSTIEALRQASELPYSRFPLEYDKADPASIFFPHLAALNMCARVLSLRTTAEVSAGQSTQALADVILMRRLIDSVRTEPFLVSQLNRLAMAQLMGQPVWEGLADHRWSDPQLAVLDAELAKLDFLADYQRGTRSWTPFIIEQSNYLRRHPPEFLNIYRADWGREGVTTASVPLMGLLSACHLVPSGWYYQNQLGAARIIAEFLEPEVDVQAHTFAPALARQGIAAETQDCHHLSPGNILECLWLQWPVPYDFPSKFAIGQSSIDMARVAVALERHRLTYGKFPDSLADLEPQFLNPVPHDLIGGQPLHYHLTADGQFLLYSVGWNGTNDGTLTVRKKSAAVSDLQAGAWTWRYPTP